jgi:hypothetical protein
MSAGFQIQADRNVRIPSLKVRVSASKRYAKLYSPGLTALFPCLALCRLRQSSVQMGVAAVNEQVLTGDVARLFRDQKDHHRGDLFGASHALSQRHF